MNYSMMGFSKSLIRIPETFIRVLNCSSTTVKKTMEYFKLVYQCLKIIMDSFIIVMELTIGVHKDAIIAYHFYYLIDKFHKKNCIIKN